MKGRPYILLLLLLTPALLFARRIEVGPGKAIRSLLAGIEKAEAGDTIMLHSGTYREGNIVISKPLSIFGLGLPLLDGENRYEQLTLTGTRIRIRGLRFARTGYSGMNDLAAIGAVDAQFLLLEDNIIEGAFFGIHLANTRNGLVRNNRIIGIPHGEQTSGNGIHLWKCEGMLVSGNDVQGHRDGIYFEFVTHSIIEKNVSHNNIRYGLHFMFSNNDTYVQNSFHGNGAGVAVMYSNHVLMLRNGFRNNWGGNAYGLLLKEISDSRILGNEFKENTTGILLESTNRMQITGNAFLSNGWALRISASCDDNGVSRNNFQGNTFDVATNGSLMLNRFHNNYWDKYEGYDLNRDGTGDVPYHPVSLYSMVIERNPQSVILLRSFMVALLDKAEKALPSLTPEDMTDEHPLMKPLNQ
jgi:nitrous oxidase accessory protein